AIENMIGKIARPSHVWVADDMPKTRSGKIMRRVLAAVSNNMPVGDVTTLANPDIVESIKVMVQSQTKRAEVTDAPDDIKQFGKAE
ncbi:MAG: acetyl-coenzyme A synthetase, partial [Bacteroidetes bacterium]|nr:acetyl-coenzyme A synthetase [Bacteroidota bacterium]